MRLEHRQQILNALRSSAGYTPRQLAELLSMPEPSVRRLVYELRKEGWLILMEYGYYTTPSLNV